jgi:N-acetylmuramoyl-L-alanine amidase
LAQGGAQAAPSPVPPEPPSPAPQPPASESVAANDVSRVAPPPIPQPRPGAEGEAAPGAAGPVLAAVIPPPREQPVPVADPQAEPLPVTQVAAPVPVPDPQAIAPRRHKGKPVVVIDPGHGGIDPGAIGISGVYEKNITLAEARDLREHLERTGRYRVYLTRDRDVFIPLHDRVVLARQYGADLFISLHADVQRDSQIRGLSVYTLSQTASDAESQALADKENKADLIAGIDLSHESSDVANILIDLAQRETMNRSSGFATDVVESAGHVVPLLVNTHRFAGFAVLKAPDVPAVLIEMGYLSNETDEHNLRQPQYRDRLARMLSHAIDLFFQEERKERRS